MSKRSQTMGDEINCAATVDGTACTVRALLESEEIILRGGAKLRIPLASIERLEVDGESLAIVHREGQLVLTLGTAKAERWRARIQNPKSRAEKLGIKRGMTVDGPAELHPEFADCGAVFSPDAQVEMLFVPLEEKIDLTPLSRVREGGAVWFIRPRGGPLKDDDVRTAARNAGWVDVKVVRFSPTHTAEKFTRRKK